MKNTTPRKTPKTVVTIPAPKGRGVIARPSVRFRSVRDYDRRAGKSLKGDE